MKAAFRLLYRSGLAREDALVQMEGLCTPDATHAEVTHLVAFIRASARGICPAYRGAASDS